MLRKTVICIAAVLIISMIVFGLYTIAAPSWDVPKTLHYQGNLFSADDNPIEGSRNTTFRIWDDETSEDAGHQKWHDTISVDFETGGYFSVELGTTDGNEFPDDLFEGPNRWLGIEIEDTGELSPRFKIHSSPYALRAAVSAAIAPGADIIAGSLTIGTDDPAAGNLKINAAGTIEYGGANTPGWVSNLGITYPGEVFSITDARGGELSPSNPGWVTVPHTTPGQYISLKTTSSVTFHDGTHTNSHLTNVGFGITETVNWAEDMPFFIYAVNKDNTDEGLRFCITRNFAMVTTPEDADKISDTAVTPANPTTDAQDTIIILGSVTESDYASKPVSRIGAFRMRWSTTTDDWTVQALEPSDGIGQIALNNTFARTWTFPPGQNGAANTSSYLRGQNGATTVPTWTNPENYVYRYIIYPNGEVSIEFTTILAGECANGSGSEYTSISLPYRRTGESYYIRQAVGTVAFGTAPTWEICAMSPDDLLSLGLSYIRSSTNNNIFLSEWNSIACDISIGRFVYKVF